MAQKHGILFKLLLALIIIVVILGVAALVFVNLTPRNVGLDTAQLTDKYTVDDLGVADIKFSQMLQLAASITKQHNQDKIATNGYRAADGTSADEKFSKTTLGLLSDVPRYKNLLYVMAVHTQPLVLSERELAYVVNSTLQQFYASQEGQLAASYVQAVDTLRRMNAQVVEMSFTTDGQKYFLKTVIKLDVKEYVAEINQNLKKISISDTVFCTLTNEIEVESSVFDYSVLNGILFQKSFVSVAINDQKEDVSQKALDALLKITSTSDELPLTSATISEGVCALLSDICKNIGRIGSENGLLGSCGIQGIDFENHKITFLP